MHLTSQRVETMREEVWTWSELFCGVVEEDRVAAWVAMKELMMGVWWMRVQVSVCCSLFVFVHDLRCRC